MLTYDKGEFFFEESVLVPEQKIVETVIRTLKADGTPLARPKKETVERIIPAARRTMIVSRARRSSVRHHGFTDKQIRQAKARSLTKAV